MSPPAIRALALFAAALVVRLLAAATSGLYVDEAFYFFMARGDLAQLAASARPDFHPPLWYALLHPIAVATRDELLLRLPSCVLGALAPPVIYLAARPLGERVGLASGAMVALTFSTCSADAQTRAYGLLAVLMAVALWGALDTSRDGAPRLPWPALALTAVMLPLLHLVGWMVDAALLAASLFPGTPRRLARATCFGCGVATGAAWIAYAATGSRSALHGYAMPGDGRGEVPFLFAYLSGLPLPLHWPGIRPVSTAEVATLVISAVVAAAAAWGWSLVARVDRRQAVVLALFLVVPFVGIAVGAERGLQTYQNRYLVPVSSAFFILLGAAAFGPASTRLARRPAAALVLAILGVNLTTLALYPSDRFLHNQDWRSAASWIEAREQPGDAIVACIPYSVVGLDFYYHAGQVDVDFSRSAAMQMRFHDDYNGAEQFAVMPSMLDSLGERLRGRRVFLVFNQAAPEMRQQVLAWFSAGWQASGELVLQGLAGWSEIVVLELTPAAPGGHR